METVKENFLNHVGYKEVKCFRIRILLSDFLSDDDDNSSQDRELPLEIPRWHEFSCKAGFTPDEYNVELRKMEKLPDFPWELIHYNSTIWYTDGTWSSVSGGDMSSPFWEHVIMPEIPEELK